MMYHLRSEIWCKYVYNIATSKGISSDVNEKLELVVILITSVIVTALLRK